jgi:hypothetical protein
MSPVSLPFASDRKFSVFNYLIGHGLLLLRSGKTDEHPTRIDILITDVRAMEIRSWFTGIEIAGADEQYLAGFQSNPVEMVEIGHRIYALNGNGWRGFVVGGACFVHEDELDFMAPSGIAHHSDAMSVLADSVRRRSP